MIRKRFLRLLTTELLDAEDDLRDLESTLVERYNAHEVTDYVYRENDSVLLQEISGLRAVRKTIESLADDQFDSLDHAAEEVMKRVTGTIEKKQLPPAIVGITRRRIDRIRRFLTESPE